MMLAAFVRSILDAVFPPTDTARLIERCSDESFISLMHPRILADGTVALLPYRHPLVRAAAIEAKFHRNARAIRLLAEVLEEYASALAEEESAFASSRYVFVPVPLSAKRERERGYNQVALVLAEAGVPFAGGLLARVRDTVPQTSLSRSERLLNMHDAFMLAGSPDSDATYIMVDDVTTTGATLAAATEAFTRAGIAARPLALAH